MKKGKFGLILFSLTVFLIILMMALQTAPKPEATGPAVLQADGEQVKLWTEDGETYYAFLPSHADSEKIQLFPQAEGVAVNGEILPQFLAEQGSYTLCWQERGQKCQGTLQIMPPSGLPTLYLDTQSGTMDHIHAQKGNSERGTARLYDEAGMLTFSDSFSSLRGRGNSTWDVPVKKPYCLDLSEAADMLGMGSAKNWILLADALDSSSLRNKIAYDFAAGVGMDGTPDSRWIEVYLNGEYAGLYLLCERIENEPERLELGRNGVLLRMDRDTRIEPEENPYFVTQSGLYLQVLDGRDSAALHSKFQDMETAVLSEEGNWYDCIDLDSWVKQYLMEEVFGSYDAGFQSQYFYLYDTEPGSRIYAGPIWDYDSSMGNLSILALQNPRSLMAWRPAAMPEYATPWYHSLYEKDAFRQELVKQYREEFLPQLESLLKGTLLNYVNQIAPAWERNRLRWNVQTDGLTAEAAHIADYLQQRTAFLGELWLEEKQFHIVRIRDDGNFYIYYAVEPGSCLLDLPYIKEEGDQIWYQTDTGEIWDLSAPIREDLLLDTEVSDREPEEKQESLMDWVLTVYYYVPAAVLIAMGLGTASISIWKSRSKTEQRRRSRV